MLLNEGKPPKSTKTFTVKYFVLITQIIAGTLVSTQAQAAVSSNQPISILHFLIWPMRGMCHGPTVSHLPSKGHIQVEGHQGPDITRKPVYDKKKYILAMGPALLCNNQSGLAWLGGRSETH